MKLLSWYVDRLMADLDEVAPATDDRVAAKWPALSARGDARIGIEKSPAPEGGTKAGLSTRPGRNF